MSKENKKKDLTKELSVRLERNADEIRSQWIQEMRKASLLAALSPREVEEQSKAIYDACLQCLKSGSYDAAETYANNMAKRAVLAAMTVDQIIAGILILRDVYGRFIFQWYQEDSAKFNSVVAVYEPVARKILNIVALAFVSERESTIRQQQEAIIKLATPIVEIWDGIVMIPLIGTLDTARARQITESVLNHVAKNKIEVVIKDISGIAAIDTKIASHFLRTIQSVRLMGADMIITGIRPDVATTLVTLGVDLSGIVTRSTLREGLQYAYSKLGLKVNKNQ